MGTASVMSFRAPKPITTGEGGMLFGSPDFIEEARALGRELSDRLKKFAQGT